MILSGDLVHFINATDEEELCFAFRALIEEFGIKHVVLAVPTSWEEHVTWKPGYKLEYSTVNTIVIKAFINLRKAPVVQYTKYLTMDKGPASL